MKLNTAQRAIFAKQKPRELAEHVRILGPKQGHQCLSKAAKATVWRILNEREVKPHKVQYLPGAQRSAV